VLLLLSGFEHISALEGEMPVDGTTLLVTFLAVFGSALAIFWYYFRSTQLLERWAEANNLGILESERINRPRQPSNWASSIYQCVFQVTVKDQDGNLRDGQVKCWLWWFGSPSQLVKVRWADESTDEIKQE